MDSTTPDPQPQQQQQPQPMQQQPRPQQQHQPHQPKPQQQQLQPQQQQPHPHQHPHPHQQHQPLPYRSVQAHPAGNYQYYAHQPQIHQFQTQAYQHYHQYYPPGPWGANPQAANFNTGLVQQPQQTNVPQTHTKQAPQIMSQGINTDQSHQQTLQTVTIKNQPVAPVPPVREKKLAILKDPETKKVLPLGTPTTTSTATTTTITTSTTSTTTTDKTSSASSSTTTAPATAVSASPTKAAAATTTTSLATNKEEKRRVDNRKQEESTTARSVQTKQNPAQALLQKASEDGLEIKASVSKNNGQDIKKVDTSNVITTTSKDKKVPSLATSSSQNVEASIPKEEVKEKINGNNIDNIESCKVVSNESETKSESPIKVSEAKEEVKATSNNGQGSIVDKDVESASETAGVEKAQSLSEPSSPKETKLSEKDDDSKSEQVNGNAEGGDDSNKDDQESESKVELHYEPWQYNPISNRTGRKVYSREFMLEVCEKICKLDLSHKESDDKIGMESNRLDALSEKYDMFAPAFSSNQNRYTLPSRQNEPARRQSQHNYVGRSSGGQDRQRKVITSVSLTQEVELKTTSNPWRPTKEVKEDAPSDEIETETLKKKFRSILNKLTPNNFESLAHAVTDLHIDTESKLGEVIDIVFAKALAEPGYCVLYGQMCSHLKKITAGQANFGNTLLKRCQHQFQSDIYSGINMKERKEKIDQEEDPEIKKQLNEELYEDMYRCRMKGLGLIKFIGELYKIEMLNDKIMFDCVLRLLSDTSEESLECLCDLLTTIGEKLDRSTQKNAEKAPKSVPKANAYSGGQSMASVVATASQQRAQQQKAAQEAQGNLTSLDQVFDQLHKIRRNKDLPLSVRIRFKLLDTCELREKDNWQSKKTKDNNPKKIEEIREAHKEKLELERRQQSAMGPRRSQEGRRGLGQQGGSSSQISSMANESSGNRGQSMHTSSSSHLLRDHSVGDTMKSNHNDIENQKEYKKKLETLLKFTSNRGSSITETTLRPTVQSLRPNLLSSGVGSLRPNSLAATPSATVTPATPSTTAQPASSAAPEKNEEHQ